MSEFVAEKKNVFHKKKKARAGFPARARLMAGRLAWRGLPQDAYPKF